MIPPYSQLDQARPSDETGVPMLVLTQLYGTWLVGTSELPLRRSRSPYIQESSRLVMAGTSVGV